MTEARLREKLDAVSSAKNVKVQVRSFFPFKLSTITTFLHDPSLLHILSHYVKALGGGFQQSFSF